MQKTRISCAILAALASSPLYAQESQSKAQFETIEVTATKRTESIQDVPVAVSALSGDALENMGIDNFQDYVEFLPNVVFQGTGPGQNEIYIRGAATTQSSITLSSVQALQPSVAFYQDEMPVSMAGRNLDIFATDVERVEVLPGPQGTLFGASSQAGTVRLITKKPDHAGFAAGFDTSLATTKGGEMSNTVEAYINLTPTDDLAIRVVAYNDKQGGWIDNIENDPGNGGYIGSAVVIDRISSGTLLDPVGMDSRREINGYTRSEAAVVSPRNSQHVEDNFNDAVYAGARFGLSYHINSDWDLLVQHTQQSLDTEGVFAYDPTVGEDKAIRFQADENSDEFGLTTWTVDGRLDKLDVVYAGGYLDREIDTLTDYTGYTNGGLYSAYYVCTNYNTDNPLDARCLDPTKYYKEDTTSTRVTHELRIDTKFDAPFRITAGLFYDEQEVASVGQFKIPNTEIFEDLAGPWNSLAGDKGINSDGGPFSPEIGFVNDITHTIEQIAVFGQAEYDITDTLTASFGARWYQIDDIYRGATSTRDVTSRLQAYGSGVTDPSVYEGLGFNPGPAQELSDALINGELDVSLLDSDGVLTVDDTIFKFGLDWKASDDLLLFANYSEGFRPPVTNRLGGDAAANQSGAFEGFRIPVYSTTDTLDNYELGMKGDFLDGIVRVNATAYYSEISDLQTSRFDPTNISFLVFTDNVGDAEVKGLDADITWLATDDLVLNAAFSLLDTELTSINPELEGIAPGVGARLPYSAEFSGNINARYYFELDGGQQGFVNASVAYTGDRLAGMVMDAYVMEDATQLIYGTGSGLKIEDEAAVYDGVGYTDANGGTFRGGRYVQESYVISNVSVGMSDDSWKVELFIDNLFDESAILNIDTQQFTPKVVTNRPRTMGVRFSFDYY